MSYLRTVALPKSPAAAEIQGSSSEADMLLTEQASALSDLFNRDDMLRLPKFLQTVHAVEQLTIDDGGLGRF